jgi:UDP-galactopyranose mutase
MSFPYDYLVVGAGLFGAVFAREATDAGKRCLVIDRRKHVAGNCHTEERLGISVHKYGPHVFHTSSERIWAYVRRFATFNHFVNRPKVCYREHVYSFPINLMTLQQVFGVRTPGEAVALVASLTRGHEDGPKESLRDWAVAQLGRQLYEMFIEGYTAKQWGRDPALLPASIIKRVPVRFTFDDNYYDDRFQGVPLGGYTTMVGRMLEGIEVRLGTDYFESRPAFDRLAAHVVYTGPIDRYFEFRFGRLEYRSLRFEEEVVSGDFQGNAVVNYTERDVPYTRITEHKHFEHSTAQRSVITREYPQTFDGRNEPYYPVADAGNQSVYERYAACAAGVAADVTFGGRLGSYRYYDMHQVVAQALSAAARHLGPRPPK